MSKRRPEDDIRLYGSLLGLTESECASMAGGGTYAARRRCAQELRRKYEASRPEPLPEENPQDGVGQVAYWQEAGVESFVYFVQAVDGGPVKIGMSKDPLSRLGELQTGNPNELAVRYVAPGDRALEGQLHHRFRDARVRGEWFGLAYLELILAYANALAQAQMEWAETYGEPGIPVAFTRRMIKPFGAERDEWFSRAGVEFCTQADLDELRNEIQRLWRVNHAPDEIAELVGVEATEVHAQLDQMRALGIYDVGRQRRPWWVFQPNRLDQAFQREAA